MADQSSSDWRDAVARKLGSWGQVPGQLDIVTNLDNPESGCTVDSVDQGTTQEAEPDDPQTRPRCAHRATP